MDPARSTWTDERLDDLSRNVDRLHEDLRFLADRMDRRFDAVDRRFDALQRLMIQVGGGTLAAILATLLSVVATRA
jgi:hypothetical protein